MADQPEQASRPAQPDPALRRLDRLVGTWTVSGDAQGQVTYEWMQGGFFLIQIQHVDLEQEGQHNTGMEVIGDQGDTLDYMYELEGDTLTIWFGEKGSPAYFQGTFSPDGDTLTGAWVYPGRRVRHHRDQGQAGAPSSTLRPSAWRWTIFQSPSSRR